MTFRIALTEDNMVNRNTFMQKLKVADSLALVFSADNGNQCLEQLKGLPHHSLPQVIFMDLEMPELDGIETIRIVKSLYPQVHHIVLTVFDDDEKIFEAIKAGASGYLLKHEPAAVLQDAVINVIEFGGSPMSPAIARKTLKLLSQSAPVEASTQSAKPYHINRIKIAVAGPWLYKRQAKLFTGLRPGLPATWNSSAHAEFTLSSDEFGGYTIPFLKSQVFYLLIENGDNPPLKIKSIATEQLRRLVTAQLEEGVSYSVLLDDPNAIAPNYDLQHFREKITGTIPLLIKSITALPQTEIIKTERSTRSWLWPAIILVVLLMAFLSWKLTHDMNKK